MLEIKLNHIAQVICDLDADILGLQEIENANVFEQLVQKLKQVGCAYDYHAITHKSNAVIQVALLSRYRIVHTSDILVSTWKRVRNILRVDIAIEAQSFTLFVNHWKSMAYKGFESKRIAYAKALQKAIGALPKEREYIIVGDMNANYNARGVLPTKLDDSKGVSAFNDILQTQAKGQYFGKKEMQKPLRGRHCSLWYDLPKAQRWSYYYKRKKSTLDHIVLPTTMFDGKGIDYKPHSFGVFRASYLLSRAGYIKGWKYKKGKHKGKGYSDHLPLYGYFSYDNSHLN